MTKKDKPHFIQIQKHRSDWTLAQDTEQLHMDALKHPVPPTINIRCQQQVVLLTETDLYGIEFRRQ